MSYDIVYKMIKGHVCTEHVHFKIGIECKDVLAFIAWRQESPIWQFSVSGECRVQAKTNKLSTHQMYKKTFQNKMKKNM